jgi:hypothetical protein
MLANNDRVDIIEKNEGFKYEYAMMPIHVNDADGMIKTVQNRLHQCAIRKKYFSDHLKNTRRISSVIFLLSRSCGGAKRTSSPCVVMNLRSSLVSQPGDVCCPGGGLSLRRDRTIARLLTLPVFSLARWPFWPWWRKNFPYKAKQIALLYAAALREGFEEMRLNPFGLTFLGCLPPQNLVLFKRIIYPQAAWINSQKHFIPNWEVERIVYLPVAELLNPSNYARYRLKMSLGRHIHPSGRHTNEFLCYIHRHDNMSDILWGATFRITMDFLRIIFGFQPPPAGILPVIKGSIKDTYFITREIPNRFSFHDSQCKNI